MTTIRPSPTPSPSPSMVLPPPMTAQPLAPMKWVTTQTALANYPEGLQCLVDLNSARIFEDAHNVQSKTGVQMQRRFLIKNAKDEVIFKANEVVSLAVENGQLQIELDVLEANNQVCMRLYRLPDKACSCTCFCCCPNTMDGKLRVSASDGKHLGEVLPVNKCCESGLEIQDGWNRVKWFAKSNNDAFGSTFNVSTHDGARVGSIKKFSSATTQAANHARSYEVQFPLEAAATTKALLLASTILVHYNLFDTGSTGHRKSSSSFGIHHHSRSRNTTHHSSSSNSNSHAHQHHHTHGSHSHTHSHSHTRGHNHHRH